MMTYYPCIPNTKKFNTMPFIQEINCTKNELSILYSNYCNIPKVLEIKTIGMSDRGYFFQFEEGECCYGESPRLAFLRAALSLPFLWDLSKSDICTALLGYIFSKEMQ